MSNLYPVFLVQFSSSNLVESLSSFVFTEAPLKSTGISVNMMRDKSAVKWLMFSTNGYSLKSSKNKPCSGFPREVSSTSTYILGLQ